MIPRLLTLAACLTALALLVVWAALAVGRFLPYDGELLYTASAGGAARLYRFDLARARSFPLLIDASSRSLAGLWSPDGCSLLVASGYRFLLANALGGAPTRVLVTRSAADATWAPDGQAFAFTASAPNGARLEIVRYDFATRRVTNVTNTPDYDDYAPAWSPDAAHIAFFSDRDYPPNNAMVNVVFDLYLMPAVGGVARRLAVAGGNPQGLHWSPDGTRLVYSANQDAATGQPLLYFYDLAAGVTLHTGVPGYQPAWSPDGTRLVFTRYTHRPHLYLASADASAVVPFAADSAYTYYYPSWRPHPCA